MRVAAEASATLPTEQKFLFADIQLPAVGYFRASLHTIHPSQLSFSVIHFRLFFSLCPSRSCHSFDHCLFYNSSPVRKSHRHSS
jgi:hypothetical protein